MIMLQRSLINFYNRRVFAVCDVIDVRVVGKAHRWTMITKEMRPGRSLEGPTSLTLKRMITAILDDQRVKKERAY